MSEEEARRAMSEKHTVVLLIDDEPDIRKTLGRRLEQEGFGVLLAASGEEGFRVATEQQPDLVLLDIMMPKMKGRDVCARLKAEPSTAHIPVIFLTALGLPDHVKAGLDMGAEDYLVKPCDPQELKMRIAICLARHQARRTAHT